MLPQYGVNNDAPPPPHLKLLRGPCLFEISLANFSLVGFLFKMNAANTEIDDYKTMSKTSTWSFQSRNEL